MPVIRRCCICRARAKPKERTYASESFERDFPACFGVQPRDCLPGEQALDPSVVDRKGQLCSTDRNIILEYRIKGWTRHDRVDCRGKAGQQGRRPIGGKRTPLTRPTVTEVEEATTSSNSNNNINSAASAGDSVHVASASSPCPCPASKHANQLSRKLSDLTETSGNEPLNRSQQILLHNLNSQALKTEATGTHIKNFQTRPRHGPGLNIFAARKTRIGSSTCSNQTRNKRSSTIEEFQTFMACDTVTSDEDQKRQSLTAQRTTTLKRNKEAYQTALEAAGFETLGSFSRETVMDLRSKMPMNAWQYLKHCLTKELGVNLMGTERELKEEIAALEFDYECVSFNDEATDKKIHAIRATDIGDVVKRAVNHLHKTSQLQFLDNLDSETLWVHISGDKGGRSTKLMMQIINATNRHSIKSAKVLGMFEGGKDSRYNIEMAFTPIFDQLKELGVRFTLDLDLPAASSTSTLRPAADSTLHQQQPEEEQMTDTLQPLDENNLTWSAECTYCGKDPPAPGLPTVETSGSDGKYESMRLTHGGDWEWLARVVGLSGPSGKHFCIHCLATRPDLTGGKGSSYGLHEHDNGTLDQSENDESSPGLCTLRTYEGCHTSHAAFHDDTDKVMDFNNCKAAPLHCDTGLIIDSISTTPLHVSLGVGLHNVNIIENMAIALDHQVRQDDIATSASIRALMSRRGDMLHELQTLADKKTDLDRETDDLVEQQDNLPLAHQQKANNAYVDKTRDAIRTRQEHKRLEKRKTAITSSLKVCDKDTKDTETNLQEIVDHLEKQKGPFKTEFDNVMDQLKLKRVVYHSGALIGPDIYKVLQPDSIVMFGNIFLPREFPTTNGLSTFGSQDLKDKVVNLLTKFSNCYRLYTKNAPLCKHEVEQLCLACAEYGAWFPINFPLENLKPKFHMLTVEMPRQVRRMRTIGMLTEQVSESIHPYMNKLERMFASTRDIPHRHRLMLRQHNILSGVL